MSQWSRAATEFGGHSLNSCYYRRSVRVESSNFCTTFCKHCLCKSDWRILFYVLMGCAVAVIVIIATLLVMFFTGQHVENPNANIGTHNPKTKSMSATRITDDNLFSIPQNIRTTNIDGGVDIENGATPATSLPDHTFRLARTEIPETSFEMATSRLIDEEYSAVGEAVPVLDTAELVSHSIQQTNQVTTPQSLGTRMEYETSLWTTVTNRFETDILSSVTLSPTVIDYAEEGSPSDMSLTHIKDDGAGESSGVALFDSKEQSVPILTSSSLSSPRSVDDGEVSSVGANYPINLELNHLEVEDSSASSPATEPKTEPMTSQPLESETTVTPTETVKPNITKLPSFDKISVDNTGWNPLPDDTFYAWLTSGISKHHRNWQRKDNDAKYVNDEEVGRLHAHPTTVRTVDGVTSKMIVSTTHKGADILVNRQSGIDQSLAEFTVADDILSEFRHTTEIHFESVTEEPKPKTEEPNELMKSNIELKENFPDDIVKPTTHASMVEDTTQTYKRQEDMDKTLSSVEFAQSKEETMDEVPHQLEGSVDSLIELDSAVSEDIIEKYIEDGKVSLKEQEQMFDGSHWKSTRGIDDVTQSSALSVKSTETEAIESDSFSIVNSTEIVAKQPQTHDTTDVTTQKTTVPLLALIRSKSTTNFISLTVTETTANEESQTNKSRNTVSVNTKGSLWPLTQATSGIGTVHEVVLSNDDNSEVDPTIPSYLSTILVNSTAVKLNVFSSTEDKQRMTTNATLTTRPSSVGGSPPTRARDDAPTETPATELSTDETTKRPILVEVPVLFVKQNANKDLVNDGIKGGAGIEVRENNRRLI